MDYLLEHTAVSVSGACGPKHDNPQQCYLPFHNSYQQQDGPLDCFENEKAFESALANETLFIAAEAFLESETSRAAPYPCRRFLLKGNAVECTTSSQLRRFGDYLERLGADQPVTITLSSLMHDLLDAYNTAIVNEGNVRRFSCGNDEEMFVEAFLATRECFFRNGDSRPFVRASFSVPRRRNCPGDILEVEIYYAWSPPLLGFEDLRNVVTEGEEFTLKPSPPHSAAFHDRNSWHAEYSLGPIGDWLLWDDRMSCLRGTVPSQAADNGGAGRLDTYTMPLEITATITKRLSHTIQIERLIRCTLPLTVKRRPDTCSSPALFPKSPNLADTSHRPLFALMRRPLAMGSPTRRSARRRSPVRRDSLMEATEHYLNGVEEPAGYERRAADDFNRRPPLGYPRPPSPIRHDEAVVIPALTCPAPAHVSAGSPMSWLGDPPEKEVLRPDSSLGNGGCAWRVRKSTMEHEAPVPSQKEIIANWDEFETAKRQITAVYMRGGPYEEDKENIQTSE